MLSQTSFLLALCITILCHSCGAGQNVIPYLQASLEDCDIDLFKANLKDCRTIDGRLTNILEKTILPNNTTCTLTSYDPNQTIEATCRDGILIMNLPHETIMQDINSPAKAVTDLAKPRNVRSFGDRTLAGIEGGFRVFGPVGAVVGGVLGFVGDIFCFIFCSKRQPPPNKPPTITKQAALHTGTPIYAKEGNTSAPVSWEAPTILDPEDGKIAVVTSPSNFKSGIEFSEGSFVVYFVGTDTGGLSVTSYIFFEVKVHRCGFPRWPGNGNIDCENSDVIFGTKCEIRCKSGYDLEEGDTSSITCGERGSWTPAMIPDCKPKDCETTPTILNGEVQCLNNKAEYDSICEAVCNDGFQVRGLRLMGCDANGKWGSKPECKDVQPPRFTHCPDDMQVYIDSLNNTAMVTWDEPKGQDNSDGKITITEIHGYEPGQRFEAKSYTIQYTIEDNEGNQGYSCSFRLKVLTLSCSPPELGENLKYDCPDSYILDAECSLACKSGFSKAGADKIRCMRDTASFPPRLEWKWTEGELAPFCNITNCSRDALEAPLNGSLACDTWLFGEMCQIQCNDKYDIPSYNDGLFVCGRSTGMWRPSSYVPDCIEKLDVSKIHLPNEYYYYTGECNNSAETLSEIKENFVKALNTSDYIEACVGFRECQAKFVNVTCGPISSRRKRSSHFYRRSLQREAYIVLFDLILPYIVEAGKGPYEIFAEHIEILNEMSDRIQAEADHGHFDIDIDDLYVDSESYGPGYPSLQCPAGMISRITTASCVGCPKGYYAIASGKCIECPFGTYQNSSNSMSCEPCPPNTNTTETRSENITQCLAYCEAGEFSPTKLAPCTKCPSNSYQPDAKSENCFRCDNYQQTPGDGATAKSQCKGFDIQLSTIGAIIQNKVTHDVTTLFMWMYLSNAKTDAVIEIKKSTPHLGLSLQFTPAITINQSGVNIETGHRIPTSTWVSVAYSVDRLSEEVNLYMNGEVLYENSSFVFTTSHVLEENDMIEFHGDMKISAFSVLQRKASPAEIASWSSTCLPLINGTVISSDDLADAENVRVIVPSVCDAVDECTSSQCGTHKCVNKLGDYECLCTDGFTGKQCQIPPDFCENNNCKNGASCVSETTNYTCQCPYGYSGILCEIKAVDGQWSRWSNWTACSTSCGDGVAVRTRRCDSPPPDPEGNNCLGNSTETIPCKEEKCPECLKLRRTYGLIISCNETSEMQRCSISCRTGLYFPSPPLPYYECGVATGYIWNHQNETNTKARLPACSPIEAPVKLGIEFDGIYRSVPCTTNNKKLVKSSLETKMSNLNCRKTDACQISVKEPICSYESRKKRTTDNSMTVTIGLGADVDSTEGGFNVMELLQNSTAPTDELIAFVNQTLELEKSAQTLLNGSVDFFKVTIDGTNYTLESGSSSLTYKSTTKCPSGTVRIDVFCAESPIGSYSDGETVTMCPVGQFQDETGQTSCKLCPQGNTTDGIGSTHVSDCSVSDDSPEGDDADEDGIDDAVMIGVGVTACVLMLTLVAVAVVLTCKHLNKKRNRIDVSNIDLNVIDVFHMQGKPLYERQLQKA